MEQNSDRSASADVRDIVATGKGGRVFARSSKADNQVPAITVPGNRKAAAAHSSPPGSAAR